MTAQIVDLEFGLKQLADNRDLLFRMYDKFIADHGQHGEDIQSLLDAQEFEQARAMFHTIKGVAGNLGLTDLYETCRFMDEAIKSNTPQVVIDDFSRFEGSLAATRTALVEIMSSSDDGQSNEGSESQSSNTELKSSLEDIQRAISGSEFISASKLKVLRDSTLPEAMVNELINQLESFDYSAAENTVKALIAST